jgi:hypothetical protein
LRDRKPETTLDVLMPLVAHTIDERLERTVWVLPYLTSARMSPNIG